MSLQTKIDAMSNKYKELKMCEFPVVKKMIIGELRQLAREASEIMDKNQHPSNSKRRRQIQDVLKKCKDIEGELQTKTEKDIGGGGLKGRNIANNCGNRSEGQSLSQAEITKMAAKSVIFHEIRTSEIKVKPEQYEQIYQRMLKNQDVMKQIQMMVKEQGNDLEKIDQYLQSTYENVQNANKELTEAQQIQKQTRRMKFKVAVSGFFAALGYKILGLPGMLVGLFTGFKAG